MRPYYNLNPPKRQESPLDRIVSVITYLTFGFGGFIWFVIATILKKPISHFLKFHVFQSIFITIILFVLSMLAEILLGFATIMPVMGDLVRLSLSTFGAVNIFGIVIPLSAPAIVGIFINCLYVYLAIIAGLGKYSDLPWISDNVKNMI